MIESLTSKLGGMSLTIEKVEQGPRGSEDIIYALILSNANEAEIMRFVLPKLFVGELRQNQSGIELLMSLDGTIFVDQPDVSDFVQVAAIGLDDLVARDISPGMLEDEPTAMEMLTNLRRRLTGALTTVDGAITFLRDRR